MYSSVKSTAARRAASATFTAVVHEDLKDAAAASQAGLSAEALVGHIETAKNALGTNVAVPKASELEVNHITALSPAPDSTPPSSPPSPTPRPSSSPAPASPPSSDSDSGLGGGAIAVVVLVGGAAGYWYYQQQQEQIRQEVAKQQKLKQQQQQQQEEEEARLEQERQLDALKVQASTDARHCCGVDTGVQLVSVDLDEVERNFKTTI